jgi:hypothetical protein
MVQLYGIGLSLRDVGKVIGRDQVTVMKHLRAEGVTLRSRGAPGQPHRADVVASEVKRLHDSGMASQELAVFYDTSLSTILNRLREAGAQIRRGRPPKLRPPTGEGSSITPGVPGEHGQSGRATVQAQELDLEAGC